MGEASDRHLKIRMRYIAAYLFVLMNGIGFGGALLDFFDWWATAVFIFLGVANVLTSYFVGKQNEKHGAEPRW